MGQARRRIIILFLSAVYALILTLLLQVGIGAAAKQTLRSITRKSGITLHFTRTRPSWLNGVSLVDVSFKAGSVSFEAPRLTISYNLLSPLLRLVGVYRPFLRFRAVHAHVQLTRGSGPPLPKTAARSPSAQANPQYVSSAFPQIVSSSLTRLLSQFYSRSNFLAGSSVALQRSSGDLIYENRSYGLRDLNFKAIIARGAGSHAQLSARFLARKAAPFSSRSMHVTNYQVRLSSSWNAGLHSFLIRGGLMPADLKAKLRPLFFEIEDSPKLLRSSIYPAHKAKARLMLSTDKKQNFTLSFQASELRRSDILVGRPTLTEPAVSGAVKVHLTFKSFSSVVARLQSWGSFGSSVSWRVSGSSHLERSDIDSAFQGNIIALKKNYSFDATQRYAVPLQQEQRGLSQFQTSLSVHEVGLDKSAGVSVTVDKLPQHRKIKVSVRLFSKTQMQFSGIVQKGKWFPTGALRVRYGAGAKFFAPGTASRYDFSSSASNETIVFNRQKTVFSRANFKKPQGSISATTGILFYPLLRTSAIRFNSAWGPGLKNAYLLVDKLPLKQLLLSTYIPLISPALYSRVAGQLFGTDTLFVTVRLQLTMTGSKLFYDLREFHITTGTKERSQDVLLASLSGEGTRFVNVRQFDGKVRGFPFSLSGSQVHPNISGDGTAIHLTASFGGDNYTADGLSRMGKLTLTSQNGSFFHYNWARRSGSLHIEPTFSPFGGPYGATLSLDQASFSPSLITFNKLSARRESYPLLKGIEATFSGKLSLDQDKLTVTKASIQSTGERPIQGQVAYKWGGTGKRYLQMNLVRYEKEQTKNEKTSESGFPVMPVALEKYSAALSWGKSQKLEGNLNFLNANLGKFLPTLFAGTFDAEGVWSAGSYNLSWKTNAFWYKKTPVKSSGQISRDRGQNLLLRDVYFKYGMLEFSHLLGVYNFKRKYGQVDAVFSRLGPAAGGIQDILSLTYKPEDHHRALLRVTQETGRSFEYQAYQTDKGYVLESRSDSSLYALYSPEEHHIKARARFGQSLSFKTDVSFAPGNFSARLSRLHLSLPLLNSVMVWDKGLSLPIVTFKEGALTGGMSVKQNGGALSFSGAIYGRDLRLWAAYFPTSPPIKGGDFSITGHGARLVLSHFLADTGRSSGVEFYGTFDSLPRSEVHLSMTGAIQGRRGVLFRYPSFGLLALKGGRVTGVLGLDFRTKKGFVFSGDLNLSQALFEKGTPLSFAPKGAFRPKSNALPFNFDMHIVSGSGVRMAYPSTIFPAIDMTLLPNQVVSFQGDVGDKTLVGRGQLEGNSGAVSYLGQSFHIQSAGVTFSPTQPLNNPYLNMSASKEITQSAAPLIVSLRVRDFLKSMTIHLSSVPYRSEQELRLAISNSNVNQYSQASTKLQSTSQFFNQVLGNLALPADRTLSSAISGALQVSLSSLSGQVSSKQALKVNVSTHILQNLFTRGENDTLVVNNDATVSSILDQTTLGLSLGLTPVFDLGINFRFAYDNSVQTHINDTLDVGAALNLRMNLPYLTLSWNTPSLSLVASTYDNPRTAPIPFPTLDLDVDVGRLILSR